MKWDLFADDIDEKDEDGMTQLHLAVQEQDYEGCKALLECGADVNAIDNNDLTPLFYAVENNDVEMCRILRQHGAYLDGMRDYDDNDDPCATPLHWAVYKKAPEACEFLLQQGASKEKEVGRYCETPLHIAASGNNVEICEMLLRYGADANACDCRMARPLHYAAGADIWRFAKSWLSTVQMSIYITTMGRLPYIYPYTVIQAENILTF